MERRPLVAMAVSMMMPGLGQVYNGEMTKGVFLFSIFAFVVPFFSYVAAEGPILMAGRVRLAWRDLRACGLHLLHP